MKPTSIPHKSKKLVFLIMGAVGSIIFFVQGMMIPLPPARLLMLLSYVVLCIPLCCFITILVWDIYKKSFVRSISFFIGFVMVPVLYIIIAFGIPVLHNSLYRIGFNPHTWQEQHEVLKQEARIPYVRLAMLDNLLGKYDLVGISQTEIELLLGEPESHFIMGYEYAYTLGVKNFFFRNTSMMGLGINFEEDVVVEVGVFGFL